MSAAGTSTSTLRRDGTVLGFDVGSRRIGVAVGSAFGHGARALAVVDVHGHGPDWVVLDRLLKEWRPDGLVVGDPLTLDDGDQPARVRAHGFARDRLAVYQALLSKPDSAGKSHLPLTRRDWYEE